MFIITMYCFQIKMIIELHYLVPYFRMNQLYFLIKLNNIFIFVLAIFNPTLFWYNFLAFLMCIIVYTNLC